MFRLLTVLIVENSSRGHYCPYYYSAYQYNLVTTIIAGILNVTISTRTRIIIRNVAVSARINNVNNAIIVTSATVVTVVFLTVTLVTVTVHTISTTIHSCDCCANLNTITIMSLSSSLLLLLVSFFLI